MRFFAFLLALVLTLQFAKADSLAFDNCEALGIENCNEFRQLNITTEQQKQLLSSLLGIKSNMNIHDFVFDWNKKLNFVGIPDSVLPENYKTIENAWLALTGIMPSVLYGKNLYINNSGFVQAKYGYKLSRPSDYFNGAWDSCTNNPATSSNEGEEGDCRTEYPENSDASFLNVFSNDKWIGNGTLVKFNTTYETNNFKSELNVVNKIQRSHYRWQEGSCCRCNRCCWRVDRRTTRCDENCERCGCNTNSKNCRYSNTDYRHDSFILSDYKTAHLEKISFSQSNILYDKAKSTAYLVLNNTDVDYYELNINEYNLVKRNLEYKYNYSYLPANVLTAKADYKPRIEANVFSTLEERNDSDFISFFLESKKAYDCEIKLFYYFNSFNLTCNVTLLPQTELNITTDKFFYMPNETIKANISIKSKTSANDAAITIRYGDYARNVTGSTILLMPAQVNANQISAEFSTDLTKQSAAAVKTISIYAGENPSYYVNVFWFVIGFLSFISALRMCWLKFVGEGND